MGSRTMMLKDFEKVPSVRGGGKQYFYCCFIPDDAGGRIKRTVVWDRFVQSWKAEQEEMRTGRSIVLGRTGMPEAAAALFGKSTKKETVQL